MNTLSAYWSLRVVLGLLLLASLLSDVRPAWAAGRCYVNVAAGGANNGTSWANAYTSLQSALSSAQCTTAWVAAGTYRPVTGGGRNSTFRLRNGLSLFGGFAGTETLLSQRDPSAHPSILSGDIGTVGNISDNSYHVVVASGTDATARLDGFTITGGNADEIFIISLRLGGGIYNEGGSPILRNLNIRGNRARSGGGGMYSSGGIPALTNVTFADNLVGIGPGGGLQNSNSDPRLTNVTFSGNSASSGGGMANTNSSSVRLTNVTFSDNSASSGNGIYNGTGSTLLVLNSILYGDAGPEIFNAGTANITFSIVQGGFPGTGNLSADPLLGPLQDNGGFTPTMALGFGSPAIDKGRNTGCPATDQRDLSRPQDGDADGTVICDMGATESRLVARIITSTAFQDGWVRETDESSGIGGTLNGTGETFVLGDNIADRQYRSILSFNTSPLPDDAVLISARLRFKFAGLVGTDPFTTHGNLLVDVRKGVFSASALLQSQDFEAPASKNAAVTVLNNPVGGWYGRTLGAASLVYINKIGVTQFRLRFKIDDNDDLDADLLRFFSGDAALAADRPTLMIRYYSP